MAATKYQVIQKIEWYFPGMVIWVDETDLIIAIQQNPKDDSTYEKVEYQKQYFDKLDYVYIEEVEEGVATKTIAQIKASYENLPKSV